MKLLGAADENVGNLGCGIGANVIFKANLENLVAVNGIDIKEDDALKLRNFVFQCLLRFLPE